jgi:hypothetical protein
MIHHRLRGRSVRSLTVATFAPMSNALIIMGAALEIIGLAFVFIELAVIRSQEFGVPTPWTRLRAWLRRLLRRPQVISVSAADSATLSGSVRAKARPGPASDNADERIARLERYVDYLDRDVDELHARIDRTAQEIAAAAKQGDEQLRREMDQRDEQRRAALRPSLRRQAAGAVCVFIGLVLGTIGNV